MFRYMEAVQGKELDRIFKEEGVIDEDDNDHEAFDNSEETLNVSIQNGQEGLHNTLKTNIYENKKNSTTYSYTHPYHIEVIGHLETEEGKDLGELVIVNRARGKTKINRRRSKFTCQFCGRTFRQRSKFIMHK